MPSFKPIKGATPFVRSLRLIMSENCMTQWEFERMCHLPQGRLSTIFSGRQPCLLKHVDCIAEGLRSLRIDPTSFYTLAQEHNALMGTAPRGRSHAHKDMKPVALIERIRQLDKALLDIRKEYDDICRCLRHAQATIRPVSTPRERRYASTR